MPVVVDDLQAKNSYSSSSRLFVLQLPKHKMGAEIALVAQWQVFKIADKGKYTFVEVHLSLCQRILKYESDQGRIYSPSLSTCNEGSKKQR